MERYFAYGSNLNIGDLGRWCERMGRSAALSGRGRAAFLPDHELVFDYLSYSRNGGVLDVRADVGKVTPGALFEVTEEDLRTLDLKEGVPLIYQRAEKRVLFADGREIQAIVYEVTPAYRSAEPVQPSEAYVAIVAEGLAEFGQDDRMLRAAALGQPTPFLVTGLFVYGTLLRGGSRHGQLERCGGVADTTPATAAGTLLDCGAFPGMLPGGEGTVHGEVVELLDVPRAFTHLDEVEGFEGFEASRALFRRALIMVRTPDGARRLVWTYLWGGGTKHPQVASGDWRTAHG